MNSNFGAHVEALRPKLYALLSMKPYKPTRKPNWSYPMHKCILTTALMFFGHTCYAGSSAVIVAEVGNWTVKKITDEFSGEITCRGDYKHNIRTYLAKDELRLVTTDQFTMDGVIIRYGEDPPKSPRKATALEARFGTVVIKGKEFLELLKHNRVRTRAILLRSSTDEDIDLTGIQDAITIMKNGCKV